MQKCGHQDGEGCRELLSSTGAAVRGGREKRLQPLEPSLSRAEPSEAVPPWGPGVSQEGLRVGWGAGPGLPNGREAWRPRRSSGWGGEPSAALVLLLQGAFPRTF